MPNNFDYAVRDMMISAGSNNQRSALEFLLWQSGGNYMKMAQSYVNDAFKVAVIAGSVDIIELLAGKNNDGTFVSPGLCSPTLGEWNFRYAIKENKNWSGITRLVDLKKNGDPRFADFELVDRGNTALCLACEVGDYDIVKYLLCRTDDGEFVFPLTNPAAQNNMPLEHACAGGHWRIIEKLLKRDESGNYIYRGIDPCRGISAACFTGRFDVLETLFSVNEGGEYVLPGMNRADFTQVLLIAIESKQRGLVEWLLRMNEDGEYVLPGIRVTEDMLTIVDQSAEMRGLLEMHL